MQLAVRNILKGIDEDPCREGLLDTPNVSIRKSKPIKELQAEGVLLRGYCDVCMFACSAWPRRCWICSVATEKRLPGK